MLRTRVGYSAGTTPHPTYHQIGDHAEAIQIDFDPAEIDYSALLDRFFAWHNAFRKPYARQYMSAVLLHHEGQREALERKLDQLPREAMTEVQDYSVFTLAEDYHQKYYLRRNPAVALELKERYVTQKEFVDSTVAARANAILGGYLELSREELRALGFSEEASSQLARKSSLLRRLTSGF